LLVAVRLDEDGLNFKPLVKVHESALSSKVLVSTGSGRVFLLPAPGLSPMEEELVLEGLKEHFRSGV